MKRKKGAFKGALCLATIPEQPYCGLSYRHKYCQRRVNHDDDSNDAEHRSWSRRWFTGDHESRPREKEQP